MDKTREQAEKAEARQMAREIERSARRMARMQGSFPAATEAGRTSEETDRIIDKLHAWADRLPAAASLVSPAKGRGWRIGPVWIKPWAGRYAGPFFEAVIERGSAMFAVFGFAVGVRWGRAR